MATFSFSFIFLFASQEGCKAAPAPAVLAFPPPDNNGVPPLDDDGVALVAIFAFSAPPFYPPSECLGILTPPAATPPLPRVHPPLPRFARANLSFSQGALLLTSPSGMIRVPPEFLFPYAMACETNAKRIKSKPRRKRGKHSDQQREESDYTIYICTVSTHILHAL